MCGDAWAKEPARGSCERVCAQPRLLGMKVLIADKLAAAGLERMRERGYELVVEPGLKADALPAALTEHQPDALVVRSTKVSAEAIAAATKLKLIVRAGAGYDTIDLAAASHAGVFIANCPGKNAIAVAELTWALILACDRRVAEQTAQLRDGQWDKKGFAKARGVFGRTLGVIGAGTIGREVIARAKAFGTPVIAWSRNLDDAKAAELGVRRAGSPLEVAREADILTLHVASKPETKGLVNDEVIDALKEGSFVINTTRGAVVDEAALLRGLNDKGLRAGLDVYANEPGSGDKSFESELAKHPSVVGTHHIGASTDQAQDATAVEAARIVEVFAETGQVDNCVNLADTSEARCMLIVRHRNKPGVLAHVFMRLSQAGINVEEMENILYAGGATACARIRLSRAPSEADIKAIAGGNEHILSVEHNELAAEDV